MARNVEIKARIESLQATAARAAALADGGPIEIEQDDTFFTCDRGRLKLRAFSADAGQLIFYRRPDHAGPKESFRVEGLGDFLELEVVLSDGERSEPAVAEAHDLMAALGITPAHLVEGAYVDLLARRRA